MLVQPTSKILHFGLVSGSPLAYEVSVLPGVSRVGPAVDSRPPLSTVMDLSNYPATNTGLGVDLYRYSKATGYRYDYFPEKGILESGHTDFGMFFRCPSPSSPPPGHPPGVFDASATLLIKVVTVAGPGGGGTRSATLHLPVAKSCGPYPQAWGWWGGYGRPDDLGHLAGGAPLVLYGLAFMAMSGGGRRRGRKGVRKGPTWWARETLTPEQTNRKGGGYLEIATLIGGGGIPSAVHLNTMIKGNSSLHEKYHFMAHLFTFATGILALSLRSRPHLRSASSLIFPLSVSAVALLFTLHHQKSPSSSSLHLVYACTMVLLGCSRLLSSSRPSKWGPVVALSSLWSGLLLCLAGEGGVEWQGREGMDVPTTAMATGIVAAGIVAAGYAGMGAGGGG
ncbi:hypothetical protein TrRE_jg638, partial [Triparma retinervis]